MFYPIQMEPVVETITSTNIKNGKIYTTTTTQKFMKIQRHPKQPKLIKTFEDVKICEKEIKEDIEWVIIEDFNVLNF